MISKQDFARLFYDVKFRIEHLEFHQSYCGLNFNNEIWKGAAVEEIIEQVFDIDVVQPLSLSTSTNTKFIFCPITNVLCVACIEISRESHGRSNSKRLELLGMSYWACFDEPTYII